MANIVIANALMPDGSKNIRIVYNTVTDTFSAVDENGDSSFINTTVPTYLEVDISSAQILSMGSSPIELLPAPGANTYYDCKIILEYTFNTTNYTTTDDLMIAFDGYGAAQLIRYLIDDTGSENTIAIWNGAGTAIERSIAYESFYTAYSTKLNKSVVLTTLDAINPTDGDGTVKAKIWYTIKNFG